MQLPTVYITGAPVTALPFDEQIAAMISWAKQRTGKVVCVANVHMLMESRWNANLRAVLEGADLITPDGMPLVWMMRWLGVKSQDRVAGMDIFLAVCREAANQNISIYLLGSTPDVLNKIQEKINEDFPGLDLAGIESPPFRPMTTTEDGDLVDRINSSGAGITFVSLGCPKQECWMAEHYGRVQSVMIGVGGVFPVYSGDKKQAPKWIRDSGLEWLFRLLQEPKRLFGRYLRTIPPFIWFAFQQISLKHFQQRSIKS
jgi:N-acetylglucosaminyldiphosphoundecaprenol N-acetyl-beta-D-mannosaminyltransferase